MSSRFVFDGLAELKAALRTLPQDLAAEASHIIEAAANASFADIKAAYPKRTSNLREGLTLEILPTGAFAAGFILKNKSPHAWIFENGTQARHTALGANRGSMPPGHVFLPIVIRRRRAMYTGPLTDLLVRNGLLVTGDV